MRGRPLSDHDGSVADLCQRPEHVTSEWLTDVLRSSGVLGDAAAIESFESVPVGTGQMADSVRFLLNCKGDESAAPRSVVAKFASTDPTSRATGLSLRSYEIEVRFYQQVADTVGIRTARCHYADIEVIDKGGWIGDRLAVFNQALEVHRQCFTEIAEGLSDGFAGADVRQQARHQDGAPACAEGRCGQPDPA